MPACWPACPPALISLSPPSLFPDKKFPVVKAHFWLNKLFYICYKDCFEQLFSVLTWETEALNESGNWRCSNLVSEFPFREKSIPSAATRLVWARSTKHNGTFPICSARSNVSEISSQVFSIKKNDCFYKLNIIKKTFTFKQILKTQLELEYHFNNIIHMMTAGKKVITFTIQNHDPLHITCFFPLLTTINAI